MKEGKTFRERTVEELENVLDSFYLGGMNKKTLAIKIIDEYLGSLNFKLKNTTDEPINGKRYLEIKKS